MRVMEPFLAPARALLASSALGARDMEGTPREAAMTVHLHFPTGPAAGGGAARSLGGGGGGYRDRSRYPRAREQLVCVKKEEPVEKTGRFSRC